MRDLLNYISNQFANLNPSELNNDEIIRFKNLNHLLKQFSKKFLQKLEDIKNKHEKIIFLKELSEERESIIEKSAILLMDISNDLDKMSDPSYHLDNILSPYVNQRNISSTTILNYGKKISTHLQADPNYIEGTPTPLHFQPPTVDFDSIIRSYLYLTSRTDGKEPTKCSTPHCNIKNKLDIKFPDGNTFHMRRPSQLEFSVDEPKQAIMKYTTDCTFPSPYNGKQIREDESLEIRTNCIVRVIAFMQGYLESDMLEYNFVIESDEYINPRQQNAIKMENAEVAERPEIDIGHVENVIETLDTPMAGFFVRTPSYTPMITPLQREPSKQSLFHKGVNICSLLNSRDYNEEKQSSVLVQTSIFLNKKMRQNQANW